MTYHTQDGLPGVRLARALLGRALGFRDCAAATLDSVIAHGHLRTVERGTYYARRGRPVDAVGILVDGEMESSITYAAGHRKILEFFKPGDLVGFIGLVDRQGHLTDLVARSRTQLLLVPCSSMLMLRGNHPELVAACETQVAARGRALYDRVGAAPSLPVDCRLARLLLSLSTSYGLPRGEQILIDVRLTQVDLADTLGLSRQSVNSSLKRLQGLGYVRTAYSEITITNSDGLARLSGDR